MKKLLTVLIAFLLVVIYVFTTNVVIEKKITDNIDLLKYFNDHDKNYNDFVMEKTITENDIVILGSSELIPIGDYEKEYTHPENLFNQGESNYNEILFGRGYCQSLQHAIDIGALQDNLKNNKIVLILSPQWFTKEHIPGQFFTRNFYDNQYIDFLQNKNISKETKLKVADRVNEMMEEYASTYERVKIYEDVYVNDSVNPIKFLITATYKKFNEIKNNYILWNKYLKNRKVNYKDEYIEVENINFDEMLSETENKGKVFSTNNDFGMFDDIYNEGFKDKLEKSKDSEINNSYAESKEYYDLELFLQVCNELGVEPLIVSVPVNGKWYDHTGFPKEGRDIYYEKIREMCKKYNANLADFSNKEYEDYFLRDSMHIGLKGWVYVNKAIYEFYKK